MDITQLLSLPYLLDKTPSGDFLFGFPLLIFFFLIMFIGSILRNPAKKNKHLRKSLRKKLWFYPYLASFGIILILTRFATLPIFSMRIILLITVFMTIILLIITCCKVRCQYSKRIKSANREAKKRRKN